MSKRIVNHKVNRFAAVQNMDEDLGAEMEIDNTKEKRNFNDTHSYASKVKKNGGTYDSCPNTPIKNQPPKRQKFFVSSSKQSELS